MSEVGYMANQQKNVANP